MRMRLVAVFVVSLTSAGGCMDGVLDVPDDVIDDLSPHFYTFTSGLEQFGGDGFDWPNENSGLLVAEFPQASFETPDGISFQNGIGNNLFFDDNYLLPDDPVADNGIVGEALWGNPRDIFEGMEVPSVVIRFDPVVASVAFDFAWVNAVGAETNPNKPDDLDPGILYIDARSGSPEDGAEPELQEFTLDHTFLAGAVFQDSTGYSGRIELTAKSTNGIGFVTIFLDTISNLGATSAFALDNFEVNSALDSIDALNGE
ncbi:MAG: hypothetical protein R3E58_07920 [Phycisphaerae bacterium]|nr:hypothetical protein [Phycisphaerales bacterium]